MCGYTILTVFENTDTINEPVISLPMAGKLSFRQIGIVTGIAVLLPMLVYSAASDVILGAFPDPVFSFEPVSGSLINVTWDVVLALIPVPFGVLLGVPRPKLLAMDELVVVLIRFWIRRTSVGSAAGGKGATRGGGGATPAPHARRNAGGSPRVGFAKRDGFESYGKKTPKQRFAVGVSELGTPKNITVTLYGTDGRPMRHRLARAYIDGVLLCSITTDSDGVIGMTFIPKSEGVKSLRIVADRLKEPVVDVELDVGVRR